MKHVLFVCLGNICRSPTAEGVFRAMLTERDAIGTDSAGTAAYHIGNPADPRAISESSSRGIDISDLRARQVRPSDFNDFDLILAMDRSNLADLLRMAPEGCRADVRLMLGTDDVPDPYYDDGFSAVFDMLDRACSDLLAELRR